MTVIDGFEVEMWYSDDGRPQCTIFWPAGSTKFSASLAWAEDFGELENTYGETKGIPEKTLSKIVCHAFEMGYND